MTKAQSVDVNSKSFLFKKKKKSILTKISMYYSREDEKVLHQARGEQL